MEFWGIEVKPGQTVKCEPGDDRVLHLSQASLGETKKEKGNDNVPIFVNINSQKLVLGTLSMEKCAQIQFDLVFEKEFDLSHGSKNTSVFFIGYRSIYQGYEGITSEDDFSDSDSEEDLLAAKKVKGNPSKTLAGKPAAEKEGFAKAENKSAKLKAKAEIKEPIKDDKSKKVEDKDDEDASDDDDDDSAEESDDDEDMIEAPGGNSSSDEDDDDDSAEEEGTPKKKVENAVKRKVDSSKTPVPEKKAKLISPAGNQKTGGDGKKVTHVATPHPAKQGGKPQQTPKSGGSVACKPCNRTFASESALQAHTKAKHGAAAK